MARNRPLVETKTPSAELAAAIGEVAEHGAALRRLDAARRPILAVHTKTWREAWERAHAEGFGMSAYAALVEAATLEKERAQ